MGFHSVGSISDLASCTVEGILKELRVRAVGKRGGTMSRGAESGSSIAKRENGELGGDGVEV